MGLNFTKREPKKSYQHVVDQIQNAICDGDIQPGDRLPPEMKLKEMFDTSRGTVREALRVLEQKGLVTIKTGVKGGATVQDVNTEAMSDSIALLIRHQKVSLSQLADFRTLLERHVAVQAAQKASVNDIQKLDAILLEAKAHVKTQPDGW
ncbi:MAG: FadR family transcriptional regulator, partial [Desulfobacteraceae bacterium]|nr:FadR family transcriptional regulator [Desulfobacteraceae bacterium]